MTAMTSKRTAAGRDDGDGREQDTVAPIRPALIVGFGNPGSEYSSTRHNVGVWCVRVLGRRYGATFERQGRIETATITVEGRTIHLARPRSYVNESGPPIAAELRRLSLDRAQLLVVYDDIDLPVGQLRIRAQGGHGGYNGMKSLLGAVGGGEFSRVRIGIDRPYDDGKPVRDPERVAGWVLAPPSNREREAIEQTLEVASDAIVLAITSGIELAMTRFNPAGG